MNCQEKVMRDPVMDEAIEFMKLSRRKVPLQLITQQIVEQQNQDLVHKTAEIAAILNSRQKEVEGTINALTDEVEAIDLTKAANFQLINLKEHLNSAKALDSKSLIRLEFNEKHLEELSLQQVSLQQKYTAFTQDLKKAGSKVPFKQELLITGANLCSYISKNNNEGKKA